MGTYAVCEVNKKGEPLAVVKSPQGQYVICDSVNWASVVRDAQNHRYSPTKSFKVFDVQQVTQLL